METQTQVGLNLRTYPYPKVTGADMAFPTFGTDPVLLGEAERRGFYNGHTPYNKLFSDLFFSGGKVVFKKDVSEEFKNAAWSYVRAFMGSWAPKHEEKEAICAMLMSELLELE
jgi:hypothetical protein